jgi:phage terminase large subunit-like protein
MKKRSKCAWLHITYFSPREAEPLDFEAKIERTLLDLHKRFFLRKVFFDPWQMQATAQRLTRAGLRIVEFPQSPANLTAASQNLFELIQGQKSCSSSRSKRLSDFLM